MGCARQQVDRQHQRLHEQAEHQRVGRRRDERDVGHRDDGAAKADRRQRKAAGGDETDDGRARFGKTLLAARPQRGDDDADGRDHDRQHLQPGQVIAEEDEAEDRGLDRLGLQIRRRHHEGAVVHRDQHQAGGDDLAERAEQQPRPERGGRPRHAVAADGTTATKKTIENGKPNRKRILVAPQVPSGPVSERCIALRATWPSAAMTVKGIQSEAMVNMGWTGGEASQRAGRGARGQRGRCMTGLRRQSNTPGYIPSATTM